MEALKCMCELFECYLSQLPSMQSALLSWLHTGSTSSALDAAGLVALADLSTAARRTALTGTSTLLDCLILCPGSHKQQHAPELHKGEYPICAAMTTGYVFRVENQATVLFLQKVGRTGELTTVFVSKKRDASKTFFRHSECLYDYRDATVASTVFYLLAVLLTTMISTLLLLLQDWWGLAVIALLIFARLINVLVIRRRAVEGWKGEPEPNAKSDLLVLLSQDRWVRIRGDVNDVKAVTSGEWLRETNFVESGLVAFATLLVYADAALAGNATKQGKVLVLFLLFSSVTLLGLVNEYTDTFHMYGRAIRVKGQRRKYRRRLDLAEHLMAETNRSDWAVRLGMAQHSGHAPADNISHSATKPAAAGQVIL